MGHRTVEERAPARQPRWALLSLLVLLSAPTCAQLGLDFARAGFERPPPVIPWSYWPELLAFMTLCFALALRETRRAFWTDRLPCLGAFGVVAALLFGTLGAAQDALLDVRCDVGGADACAWLGLRAQADGESDRAVDYLDRACRGVAPEYGGNFDPAHACLALASLHPERAPTLAVRADTRDNDRGAAAAGVLRACFVDPVPACAGACGRLAPRDINHGVYDVRSCLIALQSDVGPPAPP